MASGLQRRQLRSAAHARVIVGIAATIIGVGAGAWFVRRFLALSSETMPVVQLDAAISSGTLGDGGGGRLAIMAATEAPHLEVVGVDGDEAMLARARSKAVEAGAAVSLRQALADALPFEDASFERVVSTLFFHHLGLATELAALREVRRVLVPGGELHVADWRPPRGPLTWSASWPLRFFAGLDNTRDNFQGRLPALMSKAGLRASRTTGSVPTVFGSMVLYKCGAPSATKS